jgi:hypothetical protein
MRLWTDFNDIEDDDYVVADLDSSEIADGENDLHEGARVDLFDDGGHECQGEVAAVDRANRLVRVRIDWATWRSSAQLSEPITAEWEANSVLVQEGSFQEPHFADPLTVGGEQASLTVRR